MVESSRVQSDIINILKEHNLEDSKIHGYIKRLSVYKSPYKASLNSNLIAVCTEWKDFIDYDWKKIYDNMQHPAWVFEGRNILDIKQLEQIGFKSFFIGKS